MSNIGVFPFGQPVKEVVQQDRSRKTVFVLGVYASAVHARWVNPDKKIIVQALAVASEPYIFWRGENPDEIIKQIQIPKTVGKLVAASQQYNGPSGLALDSLILEPLGLQREDVWLCDLVPHACMNASQKKAINQYYDPIAGEYTLPLPTVPDVPKRFTDENRRLSILNELTASSARILILLGDKPIKWFLNDFDPRWSRLRDFMIDTQPYGILHEATIEGKAILVLPLAHPRQVARLGKSSKDWYNLHQEWVVDKAPGLMI